MGGCQWAFVGGPLSSVICQWSVVRCPWSVVICRRFGLSGHCAIGLLSGRTDGLEVGVEARGEFIDERLNDLYPLGSDQLSPISAPEPMLSFTEGRPGNSHKP